MKLIFGILYFSVMDEIPAYLLSFSIACESLILSVFSSLYTVYARYMTSSDSSDPDGVELVTGFLRKLCCFLCVPLICAAIVAIIQLVRLWNNYPDYRISYIFIVILIIAVPYPAIQITRKMND